LSARAVNAPALPLVTLALLAACMLALVPAVEDALVFDRGRIRAGEPWRFLTGHLVHGEVGLAAVDLVVLGALGAWCERRSRALLVAIVLAGATLASCALYGLTSFERYVGSSALGSALFAGLALDLAWSGRGARRALGLGALALFVARCVVEHAAPDLLRIAPIRSGATVAVAAHAAGGLGGALAVTAWRLAPRREPPALAG
jgi:membrane associated rhomboid family serine protease